MDEIYAQLRRSLELIMSRTIAFLDAISFSGIYSGRMANCEGHDQWAWRIDAQVSELIETVWAAEKMWRLQDRIEWSMRHRIVHNHRRYNA
jgi:hypothetical protein